MSKYTEIENPSLSVAGVPPSTRSVEAGDAHTLLRGRQFHASVQNATEVLPLLTPGLSGLFVGGESAPQSVMAVRDRYPNVPVIIEPQSVRKYCATADAPFNTADIQSASKRAPLGDLLDMQRELGSDLAMTPSGQIGRGDAKTLTAMVAAANEVDRADTILSLSLDAFWLSDSSRTRTLIEEINRSRHPIALSFVNKKSPIESGIRLKAYRRVFSEATVEVIAYRTDLSGFDALALGAITSAIGSYPSVRRVTPVGSRGGRPTEDEDLSPHVLIADLLRFAPSRVMRRDWFVSVPPLKCGCGICGGKDVSRLYDPPAQRSEGHKHNVFEIERIFSALRGADPAGLPGRWRELVLYARNAHTDLSDYLGREIRPPMDLGLWSEPLD